MGSAEIGDRASAANGVPSRTAYYIEQLKVILKSRVWGAEEEAWKHVNLISQTTELWTFTESSKTGILKGRQCRRRSA